jgi:tetratricopeptide (TPR) repeat protein
LDEDFSFGQDVVATLAELYQVKALTTRSDDKYHTRSGSYTKWMNTAQACFEKLRQKTTKLTPFLERAVGSFLCRQERFIEAIPHFKNVLEDNDETVISFSGEDKPLVSVYLEREIEARGEIDLPLKIFVYYEVVCAYLKLNEVQNAQESVLQMEKHVALFESDPDYPLILSVLGYTHKEIENRERAVEIFVSVLEINPGHAPVTVALETCH